MNLVIEEIKKLGAKRILPIHQPQNKRAGKLDQKIGFSDIGSLGDGDLLMKMTLNN